MTIRWIRRGRVDADGWEPVDIPLGEASDAYVLDVLRADGTPARSLTTDAAQALYPAADETADFGGPQTRLRVRVAQLSAAVGPGEVAEAILDIT